MAIISEGNYGSIKVIVKDDYCRCPPEEMERRKQQLDRTVSQILSAPGAMERLAALYAQQDAGA